MDNQAFLSYDCEVAVVSDSLDTEIIDGAGDTYLLSMCMTIAEDQPQMCGEYWFLIPSLSSVLDESRPDHQVLLLVDKEQYNTQSEVIVYIPTSHVLLHDADMLSLQLLHDSDEATVEAEYGQDSCWHHKPTARIIHTQNITFNKYPGQNIKGKINSLTHTKNNLECLFHSSSDTFSSKWQIPVGDGALPKK